MVNKNILKIRKKLDQLDNYFLNLVKKRTLLVDKVLKNKKYKKDIVDKKRIKIILKNINKKSRRKNIDPKITESIWKSMIKAYIDYEFRNFKKK
ncbi:chorismate mutase [Candidatus Pelagibacter bacterium]|jgi:chorismate mutase|nr:chorismate mutase [Candidatus Pelagibacter bacterium]|tara:strand:- start:100 stop:381 length:282 start_codon:yes stop_codon:yes gene_type:complete